MRDSVAKSADMARRIAQDRQFAIQERAINTVHFGRHLGIVGGGT